uniref:Uncharacterized protein n=1 Tax=Ditylenchus dipsaci TaxID=166011 RepID=A0A915EJV6_9BILA
MEEDIAEEEEQLLGRINEEAEIMDFVAVDADVITVEAEEPIITRQENQSVLNFLRLYVEKNFDDLVILKCSDERNEAFYQERRRK